MVVLMLVNFSMSQCPENEQYYNNCGPCDGKCNIQQVFF